MALPACPVLVVHEPKALGQQVHLSYTAGTQHLVQCLVEETGSVLDACDADLG